MRWFEGDIVQAVTQSRARNAVFVVFVEGENETSEKISEAINDVAVSTKLEGSNFVSIHFKSGSQTFNQFSQIYRDPPVPSLYFIGRNGSPIEIVTEIGNAKDLIDKIENIENIHLGKTPVNPTPSAPASAPTNDGVAKESEPSTSTVPLDDRVERAKELLEEKRNKKKQQEEEEARQKEMQRRKEGQNVQELKRWQQEQELKQLKEERLKEKKMEQEARQRVLDQIAQDRADRNARNASSASSPSVAQQGISAPTSAARNSNEARLQFRLPDGSTYSNRFDADATLGEVRQYILTNVTLPFRDFSLATMFPRREFFTQDNTSTLRDLELVPSSVMLILPVCDNTVTVEELENKNSIGGAMGTILEEFKNENFLGGDVGVIAEQSKTNENSTNRGMGFTQTIFMYPLTRQMLFILFLLISCFVIVFLL
ncbi:UBX domain-containing protein 4 isoform X2 [Frankliniella occidentalis]|uniref:UBX domain-containing protein 4 n=1 Tax=Frankliniella occidentalis TaxID=133901 RepID=A0A6J1S9K6_FRAOC|nr:UBX domain-containing protein 4 isoform X2 [Frankliniella occidentalis]